MALEIPSLQTLINRIVNDVLTRRDTDALLRRSDDVVYSRTNAGAFNSLYGTVKNASKEINVLTATYTLDDKAGFWLPDDPRREATAAIGLITVTGQIGDYLEAGTEYIAATTGQSYAVTEAVTFDKTSMTIKVEAVEAGKAGNLINGEILTIGTPVGTIDPTATSGGILGGTDRETDDQLRERILDRMREAPKGGAENDYKTWVKEVSGVTRVWVYPHEIGTGTVTIRFMRDGDEDPIPNESEVKKVYDHLYSLVPVTVRENYYVVAPIPDYIDLHLTIYPDTDAVRTAVNASVRDFFARESEPGGLLLLSRLNEAISAASDEYDHKLMLDNDVKAKKGHIVMLGKIIWY